VYLEYYILTHHSHSPLAILTRHSSFSDPRPEVGRESEEEKAHTPPPTTVIIYRKQSKTHRQLQT